MSQPVSDEVGAGVPPADPARAVRYLAKAAERRFPLAQTLLAELLVEAPRGVPRDFQRAARDPNLRNMATARLGHCLALRGMFDLASETLAQVQLDTGTNGEEEEIKRLLYECGILFEDEGLGQRALDVYKVIFRVDASFRDIVSRLSRHKA